MQKYREYFSKKGWCLPEDLTIPLLQMYNDIFEATPSIDGTSNGGKKESSFKSQNQPINHINRIVIFLQTMGDVHQGGLQAVRKSYIWEICCLSLQQHREGKALRLLTVPGGCNALRHLICQ